MDSFSDYLKSEAKPIWEKIFTHPFLVSIKDGTLPIDSFKYYLTQDYKYLEGFAKTVGIALSKAPSEDLLETLASRISTPVERPLHRILLPELGITLKEANETILSPTTTGYLNHMYVTALTLGLGATAACLLPCPWTYHMLREELGPSHHHVYSKWTQFYVDGLLEGSVSCWTAIVNHFAEQAGSEQQAQMRDAFLTSSKYELLFWDAAYTHQQWPI
ncbi:MAG TPA: thiaminase II [Dehalococcoidia bacterium]|jgi:thiaminase (transcriptional activator TenA)|nr:thiaminase II [Dehalococcoidia bacterium]